MSQCAAMLKTCLHLLTLNVHVQIYYAFAYPIITHGVECTGSACLKFMSPTVILQIKLIKLIFQLTRYSHSAPYAKHVGIIYLPEVYSFLLYKLAYKIFHNLRVPNSLYLLFNKI